MADEDYDRDGGGAELEEENGNTEDVQDPLLGEGEAKPEHRRSDLRKRKYMTKYERSRSLGIRVLQIRSWPYSSLF
ncbi:hypothetical protein P3L10_015166 [Capsicum annuum]